MKGRRRCETCQRRRDNEYRRRRRIWHPERDLWSQARRRARKAGLAFRIQLDDIVIPDRCPVLGITLRPGRRVVGDASPTIDRIDPRRGYVRGNIAVISHRANRIKADGSAHEHLMVATYIERMGK